VDPDEPREAGVSREMMLSPGVVPTLNGVDFIEKPPLFYWTVALLYKVFDGPSVVVARSVSVVASFLTLLLVYFWGCRDFSRTVGLVAAVGMATCVQFLMTSRWIVSDPLLMLFTTVAIWAGYDLIRGHRPGRSLLLFYGSLTLAL
jgi:4-amino-4-deoxy-L-arabinose transferase-like glycosyltransferase